MLGELHHNRPEGYDNYVDAILGLIQSSGDNVAQTHSEKRQTDLQRQSFLYSQIAQEEKDARNRVYILVGMVLLTVIVSVIVVFKK